MLKSKRANILLVDDVPANLLALRVVLDLPQYNLIEAASGLEAVELCHNQDFALIILDVHMPGWDGFQTARKIKETGRNTDVPIIFVTAIYQEDPFIKKGFDVGAVDYFGKPFNPEILKAKVAIYTDLFLKTKRLQETEEFLKSHAQIKMLLEAIPIGIIIADADGRIYERNEEADRIWGGVRTFETEHKGCWGGSGEPIESHGWPMTRALEKGEISKDKIIDIEAFDGIRRTIIDSAFPIRNMAGHIVGAIDILQDVTSRRRLAEDIENKIRTLL